MGGASLLKRTASLHMVRPVAFLRRLRRQAVNYFSIVIWLLHAIFKGRTVKLVGAVVLSTLHLGGLAAAIFAIYWYARQMETKAIVSVPLMSIQFTASDEPAFLWAVVTFSAVCFIASACFLFLSRLLVLNIAEDYYARGLANMVLLTSRLPDPRARAASQLFMQYGFGALNTGCRRGALTAIVFTNAITSIVGGAGASIFLFRIEPLLTLLILLAAGFGAVLLYPLALRAVNLANRREQAQAAFNEERRGLRQTYTQPTSNLETSDTLAHAYFSRRRIRTEFTFAIEIGLTVILALVVYYMADRAMGGAEKWAIFIVYIGALRVTLAGCSQVIGAFSSISRYYPQIIRYYAFMQSVRMIDKASLAKVRRGDALTLGTLHNGVEIAVKAGQRLALATTDTVSQMRFALLDARMAYAALPLGTIIFEPANRSIADAAVVLVDLDKLTNSSDGQPPPALDERLEDSVTLIIHRSASKVGSLGETHLLTLDDSEFRRFAPLGTNESTEVLEEFSRNSRKQRKKRFRDPNEDDDEDDDE